MPGNWTAPGGTSVKPSDVQYEAIAFSVNTALYWSTETLAGVPYLAAYIDGSAAAGGLALLMPDATLGATGVASIITNIGAHNFDLQDSTGSVLGTIAAGQSWVLILTDNGTAAGTWELIQLGATTSAADAAALAGAGLEAVAARLRVKIPTTALAVNTTLGQTYRANNVVWTGAVGTLALDAAATLTDGWWAWISNQGSGELTVGGAETINGEVSLTLPVGTDGEFYSMLVVCGNGKFYALAKVPSIISIAHGGTGADNAGDALVNLGGTAIGIDIFEAADVAAVLALLGINASAFLEHRLGSNTVLDSSDGGKAFQVQADISVSLPPSTDVDDTYYFALMANPGAVTVIPDGGDAIGQQAVGANFLMPVGTSALFVTNANGNWYPFFMQGPTTLPFAVAAGTADAIAADFSPAVTSLVNGMIVIIRTPDTNLTATPTFSPDSLTAHTIKRASAAPLYPGDITANGTYLLTYHEGGTFWELLNPSVRNLPWTTATGVNVIEAIYDPPNASLYDGLILTFRAAGANVWLNPTFSPDGLTAHLIGKNGGDPLAAGDIGGAGAEVVVQYDEANTRWEFLNPAAQTSPVILAYGDVDTGTTTIKVIDLSIWGTAFSRIDIHLHRVNRAVAEDIYVDLSTDGGATWVAAGYVWRESALAAAYATADETTGPDATRWHIMGPTAPTIAIVSGTIQLYGINDAFNARHQTSLSDNHATFLSAGSVTTSSCNAVRLRSVSGNITGGKYNVVGWV
jgi:hypothetical protein